MRTRIQIILSCLIFLLTTTLFSYSAKQPEIVAVKGTTTSNLPLQLTPTPHAKDDHSKKVVDKPYTHDVLTPTPASAQNETTDQKAIGGSNDTTEAVGTTTQPNESAQNTTALPSQTQEPEKPTPPSTPVQNTDGEKEAAINAATDAFLAEQNKPQTEVTIVNGDKSVTGNTTNNNSPKNGASVSNTVIVQPGNSASFTTGGDTRIVTGSRREPTE